MAEVVARGAAGRGHLWDVPGRVVLRRVVMLLGGQVASVGGGVVVMVVVLPGEQAVVGLVAGDDARRRRGGGGRGRGGGQVRVGDVVRASVQSQGGLGEGGMQGLRRGVRAPQTAEQRVIHRMQTHGPPGKVRRASGEG